MPFPNFPRQLTCKAHMYAFIHCFFSHLNSRPSDERYRHPSSQRRHQLWFPQDLRDLPPQNRPLGSIRTPRPRNQPHNSRRPIQSSHYREATTDRDPASTKGHRQKTLCRRVSDRTRRRPGAGPDHAHCPHPCLVGVFVVRHLRASGTPDPWNDHVTFWTLSSLSCSLSPSLSLSVIAPNLNLKCTISFHHQYPQSPLYNIIIASFFSFLITWTFCGKGLACKLGN